MLKNRKSGGTCCVGALSAVGGLTAVGELAYFTCILIMVGGLAAPFHAGGLAAPP